MRKIDTNIFEATRGRKDRFFGNVSVTFTPSGLFRVSLHNNEIVRQTPGGVEVSLAGWPTVTTRLRINSLLENIGRADVTIRQKKGKQFICNTDGREQEIDVDEWTFISV